MASKNFFLSLHRYSLLTKQFKRLVVVLMGMQRVILCSAPSSFKAVVSLTLAFSLTVLAEAASSVVLVEVVWSNDQLDGKGRIMVEADGCGGQLTATSFRMVK